MAKSLVRVKPRYPSLQTLGLAVQHFPHFISSDFPPHAVDVVLLSFIVRGRGTHQIDQDRYPESGASLAVTHHDQRHKIVTGPRGMEIINVYLDLDRHVLPVLPPALQRVLPLLLPLHPHFVNRLNRIVRLQFDDPKPLAQHLLAIAGELTARSVGYQEAAMLHWKLFLMQCCRQALRSGFVPPVDAPVGVEEVRQHLDRTFAQHHALAALARRAGLSRTSLCRAFKAHTGKSVFDYLIDRRIQATMVRLRGSDEKIAAIAMDCGFNDLAYFNRKFRQLLGQTPREYRG